MQILDHINNSDDSTNENSHGEKAMVVPMYSRKEGLQTQFTGVATEDGLFAADFDSDNDTAVRVQDECYNEPVEVTVSLDEILHEGEVIGTLLRYDGSSYDPSAENPGNIEVVHKYQRSGRRILTSQDARRRGLDFRAHGQTLVNHMAKSLNRPDAGERITKFLQFIDAVFGDAVEVDYDTLSFEASGSSPRAADVSFLQKKVKDAMENVLGKEIEVSSSDDPGEGSDEDGEGSDEDNDAKSEENDAKSEENGAEGEEENDSIEDLNDGDLEKIMGEDNNGPEFGS